MFESITNVLTQQQKKNTFSLRTKLDISKRLHPWKSQHKARISPNIFFFFNSCTRYKEDTIPYSLRVLLPRSKISSNI